MFQQRKRSQITLLAVTIYLLGSCSTSYQEMSKGDVGYRGGYEDRAVGPGEFYVKFEGNMHTARDTAIQYWERRATELCGSRGYEVESRSVTEGSSVLVEGQVRCGSG